MGLFACKSSEMGQLIIEIKSVTKIGQRISGKRVWSASSAENWLVT